jgi:hypothetical protein
LICQVFTPPLQKKTQGKRENWKKRGMLSFIFGGGGVQERALSPIFLDTQVPRPRAYKRSSISIEEYNKMKAAGKLSEELPYCNVPEEDITRVIVHDEGKKEGEKHEEEEDEKDEDEDNEEAELLHASTKFMNMTEIGYEDAEHLLFSPPPLILALRPYSNVEFWMKQFTVSISISKRQLGSFGSFQSITMPLLRDWDNSGHVIMPLSLRVLVSDNKEFPVPLEWGFQNVTTPFISPAGRLMNYTDKDLLPASENWEEKARKVASIQMNLEEKYYFSLQSLMSGCILLGSIGGQYHELLKEHYFLIIPAGYSYLQQLRLVAEELLTGEDWEVEVPSSIVRFNGTNWNCGPEIWTWRKNKQLQQLLLNMYDGGEGWKTSQLLAEVAARIIEDRLVQSFLPFRKQLPKEAQHRAPSTTESSSYTVTVRRFDHRPFTTIPFQDSITDSATLHTSITCVLFYTLLRWPFMLDDDPTPKVKIEKDSSSSKERSSNTVVARRDSWKTPVHFTSSSSKLNK